jgi:hypothetical protein
MKGREGKGREGQGGGLAGPSADIGMAVSVPPPPFGFMPPQELRGGYRVLRFLSEMMVKVVIMLYLMHM